MRTLFDFGFRIMDFGSCGAGDLAAENAEREKDTKVLPTKDTNYTKNREKSARSSAFRRQGVKQSNACQSADAPPPKAGTPCHKSKISALLPFLLTVFLSPSLFAQWQTQTITLKPGWNAVYLHVDASHVILDEELPIPIEEIWRWQPSLAPDRFINDPQQPASGSDWKSWHKSVEVSDTLSALIGNAAYLVRTGGTADFVWSLKGKPVPPRYEWTSKGVNFLGFSTPQGNPPLFANFLGPVPRLASEGELFRYDDGNNDLTPSSFKAFFNTTPVNRGQAYWIRHPNQFNRYFGAFEVTLQSSSGIHFRDFIDRYTLRLRNQTPSAITITINLHASESPPVGQMEVVDSPPPLLRRGELDVQNLTYNFTTFDAPQTVTLKPRGEIGSEAEIILGINRLAMNGAAGDLFAGILRLTDSLGYTQIDLPVSATQASGRASFASGLWVGNAIVNQVRHQLKNYLRDTDGNLVTSKVTTGGAPYVVASTNTSLGAVARPFNLRLIVHKSDSEPRLFQRIHHGLGLGTNVVLTATQDLLHPDLLSSARRISAVHLPFSSVNSGWPFTGQFAQGQTITAQINLAHDDDESNPFLHNFHPDHDNLNATFDDSEVRGAETYDIERKITLVIAPPAVDFRSVTAAGNEISGQYSEEINLKGRGAESRRIDTAGVFLLKRISDIGTVTQ